MTKNLVFSPFNSPTGLGGLDRQDGREPVGIDNDPLFPHETCVSFVVAIFGVQEKKGEKFFYLFFQPFNLITSKARRFTHNFEVIRLKGFVDFLVV